MQEDVVAARTIRLLQDSGLRVPGDVSVTGCNNFAISRLMTPTIATFELPVRELGREVRSRA